MKKLLGFFIIALLFLITAPMNAPPVDMEDDNMPQLEQSATIDMPVDVLQLNDILIEESIFMLVTLNQEKESPFPESEMTDVNRWYLAAYNSYSNFHSGTKYMNHMVYLAIKNQREHPGKQNRRDWCHTDTGELPGPAIWQA